MHARNGTGTHLAVDTAATHSAVETESNHIMLMHLALASGPTSFSSSSVCSHGAKVAWHPWYHGTRDQVNHTHCNDTRTRSNNHDAMVVHMSTTRASWNVLDGLDAEQRR